MLIRKEFKIHDPERYAMLDETALCFDIETTGLNKYTTHITVIGTGYVRDDRIVFLQWLLEDPSKEREMLTGFSDYLKNFTSILQFNGASFDIPYVAKRCALFHLPDPFAEMNCIDLYRSAKRLKSFLSLENLKQKSLESLFRIRRKDRISGRDCIFAYQDFLRYGDLSARDALLLHNEEDVTGLLALSGLMVFDRLPDAVKETAGSFEGDDYILRFSLDHPVPFPVSRQTGSFRLELADSYGCLTLFGTRCVRKYFFADYQNYFYLPAEDHAIHKSVGIYVDKEFRCRATRANCYEKAEDIYYYQPADLLAPAFKENYKDTHSWINQKSIEKASAEEVTSLCRAYLSELFGN